MHIYFSIPVNYFENFLLPIIHLRNSLWIFRACRGKVYDICLGFSLDFHRRRKHTPISPPSEVEA